jgi:flagellar biosynthetic protein FliQ
MTFVPKILAVFAALVVTGPWLLNSLVNYTAGLFTMLPSMVR